MSTILISTDKSKIDLNFVHHYLSEESYWAKGRSFKEVQISIDHSLCFGLYLSSGRQIGFVRVATDYVVFAWIMDVFIDKRYRKKGYSKLLLQAVLNDSKLKNVKGFGLRTNDAHALYQQFGFSKIPSPDTWMFRNNENINHPKSNILSL